MKKMALAGLSSFLFLTACNSTPNESDETNQTAADNEQNEEAVEADVEEANTEEIETPENESTEEAAPEENENNTVENQEEAVEEISEGEWETQVGETVENEGGTFTLHARKDDIETIETGPVVMEIEQLNAQSGELAPDLADVLETEELDMIQMDLSVENTSEEDISFYASQATIATSTGEQLEPDFLLSDYIDGEMLSGTKASGTLFFILENSNASDVETVRMIWSAPTNEDFDRIGEEVDIEIEF